MKTVIIFYYIISIISAQKCIPRSFGADSFVCVCNSTYCDAVDVEVPPRGQFKVYSSNPNGLRFQTQVLNFENESDSLLQLTVNLQKKRQTILGFGGAFTDAAGINIQTLSKNTQEQLLQTYFAKNGSNYNLGRIPAGGTDFSTHPYTLDDFRGDISLSNFSLTREDNEYKIPYMQRARAINPELQFIAASWTAPPWMKTNNDYRGFLGFLKREYYQIYANYLVKFLEIYKSKNLPIWAISTGNEPSNVFMPFVGINDMGWTPGSVTDWVVNNLGPTIANSTSNETIIVSLDDQRFDLPWYIQAMYKYNSEIDKYMAGIAIHWYGDQVFPIELYDKTHAAFPNKFIIMTEACTGALPWEYRGVFLGSWERGERYILDIIEDMNHWITGWIDWNLALDKAGGPNWVENIVDASIIVSPETDEFFKQPMYYAIAHFSKFIPRGSVSVDVTEKWNYENIKSTAFITPDNNIVIVLYNMSNFTTNLSVVDPAQGIMNIKIPGRTVQTIIYSIN